uniref:Uncharacterized protein n=1 Tax=Siphoviridae sp. ctYKh4 TaxID=2823586 RepID=A0A8S5LCC3_9CAUD|nr:MAG TPA: hypothetical protein [Siphoviridae sp. ctYKh4]
MYALQTDSSTSFAGFTKTVQMIFIFCQVAGQKQRFYLPCAFSR